MHEWLRVLGALPEDPGWVPSSAQEAHSQPPVTPVAKLLNPLQASEDSDAQADKHTHLLKTKENL